MVVHENYSHTEKRNAIALLKTSNNIHITIIPLNAKEGQNINIAGEQVDLSSFSPACLPSEDQKFSDEKGIVAGQIFLSYFYAFYKVQTVPIAVTMAFIN